MVSRVSVAIAAILLCALSATASTSDLDVSVAGHRRDLLAKCKNAPNCARCNTAQGKDCNLCASGYGLPEDSPQTCQACEVHCGKNADGTQPDCANGANYNGFFCKSCGDGYSKPTIDSRGFCEACPAGTMGMRYGNTPQKFSSCEVCKAGQYQNVTGQTMCLDCPKGNYSPQQMSSGCLGCAVNTYQNVTGQTSCNVCPTNSEAPVNATSIDQCVCKSGYYRVTPPMGDFQCMACTCGDQSPNTLDPRGACNASDGTCTSCAAGYGLSNGKCTMCTATVNYSKGGTGPCKPCTGCAMSGGNSRCNTKDGCELCRGPNPRPPVNADGTCPVTTGG